jgi:hypothetical protein
MESEQYAVAMSGVAFWKRFLMFRADSNSELFMETTLQFCEQLGKQEISA